MPKKCFDQALGPNINAPIGDVTIAPTWQAVQDALARSEFENTAEQVLNGLDQPREKITIERQHLWRNADIKPAVAWQN